MVTHGRIASALLVTLLAVTFMGCGGQMTTPAATADGDIDSSVDAPVDGEPMDTTPPFSAQCTTDGGACTEECTQTLGYADLTRRCSEDAYTCLDSPFIPDGGLCGVVYCFVDQNNGYIFTTNCVILTASRWRPCTQAENDSLQDVFRHCDPPYKVEGQFF